MEKHSLYKSEEDVLENEDVYILAKNIEEDIKKE